MKKSQPGAQQSRSTSSKGSMSISNKAAIYLRRSAVDESGEDRSINYQREACERIAEVQGLEIVEIYNEGDGQPASIFKENERPEYDRAMRDLGKQYTVLIAYAVDRLSRRGMTVVGQMLDTAERQGGRILTNDGLDTSHETSRLIASFMGEMARSEVNKLSQRVSASKAQIRKSGHWQGGTAPYGLKRVTAPDGPPMLAVDQSEAKVIVEIVDRYLDGASTSGVSSWLNERGVPSKKGGKWTHGTIYTLIQQVHLIGQRSYGPLKSRTIACDDERNPLRVTEPIISDAKFYLLQKARTSRSTSSGNKHSSRGTSLLGGLVHCSSTSQTMNHASKSSSKRTWQKKYYQCRCCQPRNHAWADELKTFVAQRALLFVASLEPDSPILEEVGHRMVARFTPEQTGQREDLEGNLLGLESRLKELTADYYRDGKIPKETFDEIECQLQIKIDTVTAELRTLPAVTPDLSILFDLTAANDDPDGDLVGEGSAWFQLEEHLKRSIMLILVDKIWVDYAMPLTDGYHDLEARVRIEFAAESNVVELSKRHPERPNAHKKSKVALTA